MSAYVLVQPPQDGHVHACQRLSDYASSDCVCGKSVGGKWKIVRSYRSKGVTRMRVTCPRCKAALSSLMPVPGRRAA